METIVVSNGVETIDEECFSYNQFLSSISLPTSLQEIKEDIFYNAFLTDIQLPTVVKGGSLVIGNVFCK